MVLLLGIIKIIILLGTLVTIHELGHFLVAKACKIKVYKFSIGFGPKILTKKKGETEYSLRAIPLGGFVQLEGEDGAADDERAFNNKPVWQRMLVVVAGATVNILFAFALYLIITININIYPLSIIDKIDSDSIAYLQGLRENDVITKIDKNKIYFSAQISNYISESDKQDYVFTVERDGESKELNINIPEKKIGYLGAAFSEDGTIVQIIDDSSAQKYGLCNGDKIISINDKNNISVSDFVNEIKSNANNNVSVTIERNGEKVVINLIPEEKNVKLFDAKYRTVTGQSFWKNLFYAIKETKYYFSESIKAFIKIITGGSKNAEIMGPVGIAGEITKTQDVYEFFYLMSAISFSLGVCNLLPIPGLDGGKLLLLLIELFRKKPLEQKTEIAVQLAGFVAIIGLSLFVTVKDIIKLF